MRKRMRQIILLWGVLIMCLGLFAGCRDFGYEFHYSVVGENGVLPASVTHIGACAFYYCEGLTKVNFAANARLADIGDCAFENTALTSVTIPQSVTAIGANPFVGCSNLDSISIESGNPFYASYYNCLIFLCDFCNYSNAR
jgi:hypothetical protein